MEKKAISNFSFKMASCYWVVGIRMMIFFFVFFCIFNFQKMIKIKQLLQMLNKVKCDYDKENG